MPIFESIRQRGGDSCYFPVSLHTPSVSVGTAFIRGAHAHRAPHITVSHCHSSMDLVRLIKEKRTILKIIVHCSPLTNQTKMHKLTSLLQHPQQSNDRSSKTRTDSDNDSTFSDRNTPLSSRKTSIPIRASVTPGGSRPVSRQGTPSRHGSTMSLVSDDGTPSRIPTRRLGSSSTAPKSNTRLTVSSTLSSAQKTRNVSTSSR